MPLIDRLSISWMEINRSNFPPFSTFGIRFSPGLCLLCALKKNLLRIRWFFGSMVVRSGCWILFMNMKFTSTKSTMFYLISSDPMLINLISSKNVVTLVAKFFLNDGVDQLY